MLTPNKSWGVQEQSIGQHKGYVHTSGSDKALLQVSEATVAKLKHDWLAQLQTSEAYSLQRNFQIFMLLYLISYFSGNIYAQSCSSNLLRIVTMQL